MQRRKGRRDRLVCRDCRRSRSAGCLSSFAGICFGNDHRASLKRTVIVLVMLTALLCPSVGAIDQGEVLESQAEALDLDELERVAGEYAPKIDWTGEIDLDSGLKSVLETGTKSLNGIIKKSLRSGVLVLVVVLFSGLAIGTVAGGEQKVVQAVPIAASLAITAISVVDANALIGLGRETVEKMEVFSQVLLPTVAAAAAAAGAPGAAAARQMATVLFSDILMSLINRLLLPLVYAYIAAITAAAAIGNDGLKRIAATLKWLVTSVLTIVLLVFVGYLTVSGVIAGTTDALTLKATKFTVSSVVPVVGGILSDAAETVLAGAGILKNSIGIFGMLSILGMCIGPFLQLGVNYLMYKVTAALSATVAETRIVGLIDGLGGAFGLVLGMTGACALLLLISMVSAISLTAL